MGDEGSGEGVQALAVALVLVALIAAVVTLVVTGHEETAATLGLVLFIAFMAFFG